MHLSLLCLLFSAAGSAFIGRPATAYEENHTGNTASAKACPAAAKFGAGPPATCTAPSDPRNKTASPLEQWFTKEMFEDLFPFANLGWGPNRCWPYSYEAFVIAARYFPEFGTSSRNQVYTAAQNNRRDLAAFFAHAIQETGENNVGLYRTMPTEEARNCFYRGGFFNWFEGGPTSAFLDPRSPGYQPADGAKCLAGGRYCAESALLDYYYKCNTEPATGGGLFKGCYFGRGAIQISYNYNYGMFQEWLATQGIEVDLLTNPNLVMTKMDPPLAVMASLWFYMTPQPPKPAMHDIVLGDWNSGEVNAAAGYTGPIFGPTSLVINNECHGEDSSEPGGGGENRRIKAFKWFCDYFRVPAGEDKVLSCKDMPVKLASIRFNYSYQPDWASTWKSDAPCNCAPATYGGMIPYYQPGFIPDRFVAQNGANRKRCVKDLYAQPGLFGLNPATDACLTQKPDP